MSWCAKMVIWLTQAVDRAAALKELEYIRMKSAEATLAIEANKMSEEDRVAAKSMLAQKAAFETQLAASKEAKRKVEEEAAAVIAEELRLKLEAEAEVVQAAADLKAKAKADKVMAKQAKKDAKKAAREAEKQAARDGKQADKDGKAAKIAADKAKFKENAEDEEEYHFADVRRGAGTVMLMQCFLVLMVLGAVVGAIVYVHITYIRACTMPNLIKGDSLLKNFRYVPSQRTPVRFALSLTSALSSSAARSTLGRSSSRRTAGQ